MMILMDEKDFTKELINLFENEYKGIERIEVEDGTLIIYADDDTLWKILEDKRAEFSMEFEGGGKEAHFVRVLV